MRRRRLRQFATAGIVETAGRSPTGDPLYRWHPGMAYLHQAEGPDRPTSQASDRHRPRAVISSRANSAGWVTIPTWPPGRSTTLVPSRSASTAFGW